MFFVVLFEYCYFFFCYVGCGDYIFEEISFLLDLCFLLNVEKKRFLNERERFMYVFLFGVGGVVYDKVVISIVIIYLYY